MTVQQNVSNTDKATAFSNLGSSFLGLSDTPSALVPNATVAVNSTGTALVFGGISTAPSYTVGALPTVVVGGVIIVTNASTGPTLCVGFGGNWINVVTGVAVV